MRLEMTHRFAVPLRSGFDYIVEPHNWPQYWPGLVRVQAGSQWRAPGDRTRVVMRLLGRSVELEMTLRTFEPCRLVEYVSVQRQLPDARHERGFAAVGEGSSTASRSSSSRVRGCAGRSTANSCAARSCGRCGARSPTSTCACRASPASRQDERGAVGAQPALGSYR